MLAEWLHPEQAWRLARVIEDRRALLSRRLIVGAAGAVIYAFVLGIGPALGWLALYAGLLVVETKAFPNDQSVAAHPRAALALLFVLGAVFNGIALFAPFSIGEIGFGIAGLHIASALVNVVLFTRASQSAFIAAALPGFLALAFMPLAAMATGASLVETIAIGGAACVTLLSVIGYWKEAGAGLTREIEAVAESDRRRVEAEQARAEAERAAAAKGDFLANMSHEVRTPLTSVMGYADLILTSSHAVGDTRRYAEHIRHAGEALLLTVDDVLDLSRLESGRISTQPRPTDIDALARDVCAMLQPQAADKGVSITMRQWPRDLVVEADTGRVRQVLINLMGNALKFTEQGGVHLDVDYFGESGRLRFSVRDTGPGVPKEMQDLLFQRFSQISKGKTKRGTGLGLAISKALVQAMGGAIGVESAEGKGALFWFELPALRIEPLAAGGAAPMQGLRVLLAQAAGPESDLARAALLLHHAEIQFTTDASAARELALEWPFDIVLIDPDCAGDGWALARAMRGVGPNRDTPILALGGAGAAADFAAAGFDAQIAKPMSAASLLSAVARLTSAEPLPPAEETSYAA